MKDNPDRTICDHDVPINWDCKKCSSYTSDKSFIVVLSRMKEQALEAVRRSDPSAEDQVQDGIKLGRLYQMEEVIKAFKQYG